MYVILIIVAVAAYWIAWFAIVAAKFVLSEDKIAELREAVEAESEGRERTRVQAFEAARQALEAEQRAAISQSLRELRETAEERYRSELPVADPDLLDRRLKEASKITNHRGRELTVRVLVSRSGFVGFEWMLNPDRPQPLRVVCTQDGNPVFGGHYEFRGIFVLPLKRGASHLFQFSAFEGKKDCEDDFHFVVRVPTDAQWERGAESAPVPLLGDDISRMVEQIREAVRNITDIDDEWEKARREAHARIDASDAADTEKRRRKATLDSRLLEARVEIEQERASGRPKPNE